MHSFPCGGMCIYTHVHGRPYLCSISTGPRTAFVAAGHASACTDSRTFVWYFAHQYKDNLKLLFIYSYKGVQHGTAHFIQTYITRTHQTPQLFLTFVEVPLSAYSSAGRRDLHSLGMINFRDPRTYLMTSIRSQSCHRS